MNPSTSSSSSPQIPERYGALFLAATLFLLIPMGMSISLSLSLHNQETMPDLTHYLAMGMLLGLVVAGYFMLRARQEPVVRALRLGTITGCILGVLFSCLYFLPLLGWLFFYTISAIPLLIYNAIFHTIPSFPTGDIFIVMVQLLPFIALTVPAELTVQYTGSIRYGFLSAFVTALYAPVIGTLIVMIFTLVGGGFELQDGCVNRLGYDLMRFQGLCSFLVDYKSLCVFSMLILFDLLILSFIAGLIGSFIGRLPDR